ncbi:Lrp/AsnC ligand binding domain-containing protein [Acinetobacter schindleri]|uniref:Lrp/AsnC ligand binding domain-containing protein n=1 Tax=Acinetobacter schindleri TaxID=108981 RepID=UPI003215C8DA
MRKLDRIDRMILYILQRDGRIAISELAARVNLSTTPCSERVKRLERDGIIMGYYARLNPEKLERNLLVFLEIKLSAKSGDVFEQVARDLSEIPEVLECHLISGDFDYLVKARLKEMSAYRRLLGDLLKKLPSSASSHSYVVMEEVKETLYLDVGI